MSRKLTYHQPDPHRATYDLLLDGRAVATVDSTRDCTGRFTATLADGTPLGVFADETVADRAVADHLGVDVDIVPMRIVRR